MNVNSEINETLSITFSITKNEDFLIADAIGYPIVTQAKTWNKLIERIDEVIRLFFELGNDEKYNLCLKLSSKVIK